MYYTDIINLFMQMLTSYGYVCYKVSTSGSVCVLLNVKTHNIKGIVGTDVTIDLCIDLFLYVSCYVCQLIGNLLKVVVSYM